MYKCRIFLLIGDFFSFIKGLHQFSRLPVYLCRRVCIQDQIACICIDPKNKDVQYLPDFLYLKAPQSISEDYCPTQSSTSEKII